MYQVYFIDFQDGVLEGGGTRLAMKIASVGIIYFILRNYFSFRAFVLNLGIKLPLLIVSCSILLLIPILSALYLQAVNIAFFLPLLLIDWNRVDAALLYRYIWLVVAGCTGLQLVLDPIIRPYMAGGWENQAFIGGMGNPNVFGVFMTCAGLACWFFLKPPCRYLCIPLYAATALTGSLAAALAGWSCLGVLMLSLFARAPFKALCITLYVLVPLGLAVLQVDAIADSRAAGHAWLKLQAVGSLLTDGIASGSSSISIRTTYATEGFALLAAYPYALLTGHPNMIPMFNGDGLWVSFIVTYGLPVTLAFLLSNLYVLSRGIRSSSIPMRFSAAIISVILFFFVTNRILDYWPVSFMYLLAFTFLATYRVAPSSEIAAPRLARAVANV